VKERRVATIEREVKFIRPSDPYFVHVYYIMASVKPEKIKKLPSSMTTFKTHGIKTEFQPTTTNDGEDLFLD
jgi:hypothetical protein